MKRMIFFISTIVCVLISLQLFSEDFNLPIFEKGMSFNITWHKCGNDNPDHNVKFNEITNTINWVWSNKNSIWCGWGSENLPSKDLSKFEKGYLVIKFIGFYTGNPPEVKFLGFDESKTKLISFKSFISGNPNTGAIVKIPIKTFSFNPDAGVDIKSVKSIQFDAEYNSTSGNIKIQYIGLSTK